MKPVHILSIAPSFNTCGGIERYCINYLSHFDDRIKMDFITHDKKDDSLSYEVKKRGGHVYVFPSFSGKNLPGTLGVLRKFFKSSHGKYDIIHCHMANAACFYFPYAKSAGINIRILHSHQDRAADVLSHAIRNTPLLACGVPMATHLLACSKQAGDFLFKKRPYRVIPNAIDAKSFRFNPDERASFRRKYGLGDSFVIGTIGRLTEQKNHSRLLDILNTIVNKKGIPAQLLIVGEGHLLPALMKKTAELSLENNVVFTGSIAKAAPALSAMDVFVLPSLYEGLGIVNIEAQANGLSVVASDGIPEDARMSDSFYLLPLSASDDIWAEQILSAPVRSDDERQSAKHTENIISHGYDLSTEAQKMEEYYLNL